ncbi:MAG: flap endonuclease [Clostridia bacterium]|nr:flap endonuclease [Clostridia bacterium]
MNKLLLVDGHCLLFQMFYGMPARIIGKDGKPIQGTLGFVGAMRKILTMTQPSHVAAIFDGETHNPRTDLDADYKANREDFSLVADEDNPFLQLPDIYRALDFMGIAHTETIDCETDDVLAAYAKAYGGECEVIICSQDSDFFQLISKNVSVLRYRGEKSVTCDVAYMRERFGILPEQYAFFKSLTGDGSDNIKGIPGIGPKTAAALVNQFNTPASLLQNADLIKQPKLRESVRQNAERLALNVKLITLDGCATIPFLPEQMLFCGQSFTTNEVLQGIGIK